MIQSLYNSPKITDPVKLRALLGAVLLIGSDLDLESLLRSIVEYAVAHLKVKKVVVCGHTKCGGANAALSDADLGQTLNTWLHPVRE